MNFHLLLPVTVSLLMFACNVIGSGITSQYRPKIAENADRPPYPWESVSATSTHASLRSSSIKYSGPVSLLNNSISRQTNFSYNGQLALPNLSCYTPAVAPDGTIFAPYNFGLSAINPDMSVKWQKDCSFSGVYPIIGPDGTVYFVENFPSITLKAVYPQNGLQKWSCELGNFGFESDFCAPAISPNGTVYVAVNYYVFAIKNGAVEWIFSDTNAVACPFANSKISLSSDGSIYVTDVIGRLFAINSDGSLKWIADPQCFATFPVSPAIAADGTIYYGIDGSFFAVSPNGVFKWTNSIPGINFGWSPQIGADGTVYAQAFGYPTNMFCALNCQNGAIKWKRSLSSYTGGMCNPFVAKSAACALMADGQIIVTDLDGTIYSFDSDGNVNWSYIAVEYASLGTPVIGPEGNIYATSSDVPYLFSFSTPSRIACLGWPEMGKNSRHTSACIQTNYISSIRNSAMTTMGFSLSIVAPENSVECLCSTPDFVNWTNLAQIVFTNASTVDYIDATASNQSQLFYLVSPQ